MASQNVSVLERVKGVFGGGGKKSKKKGKGKGKGRPKTLQFEDTGTRKTKKKSPNTKAPDHQSGFKFYKNCGALDF